jgi:ATP-dependent Lhr-like helicase
MTVLDAFHPAVARWFSRTFAAPTAAQEQAWPAIQAGKDVLIAAPTGSGKTLAAFLAGLDSLIRAGLNGTLADETYLIYVSPLKALSNDINRNLEAPLAGIREELAALGLPDVVVRTWVRTGDTPQHERASMRKQSPHVVVTTPESLYVLLGSASGREMLKSTRSVIVDEIHAMAGNKRGVHLALSLERLTALTGCRPVRVGLSATQKPITTVADFLSGMPAGSTKADCTVVDTGHTRTRDLALELPLAPLEAVMSGEVWLQIYDRLAELISAHRTTLVFVNTRRLAERLARHLSERIGTEYVTAHHGSLAKELRLNAEQRLKRGELKALVATASLELGIDIGDVDLVCQLSSPHSINAFLQRVGRSGHAIGGTPKGRLFPLSRDDLVECTALLRAVREGELDRLLMPENALDVLAQQIVAEVGASEEWHADALYELCRRAYPYRNLERARFDAIVQMLAEGFSTRRGRQRALIHYDAIHRQLRPRRGTRLTALTSGGTIPDMADYQVILEPEAQLVGTLNEDFAVESLAGDIFQLGNASYRIRRVERGVVRVEDAKGQPPSLPFWLGEARGRTDELSAAVAGLRKQIDQLLGPELNQERVRHWLQAAPELAVGEPAALQLTEYLAAARAALGCLPTLDTIIFERFFDEAGGMQLVVHSPFGSRVNRAWGLALRKRFCRQFNFELQAAATEDCIILSLTTAHSFELASVARYLSSSSARHVLVQAVCGAPMFATRWRWVAGVSLALPRMRGGKKVPPQLARMNAEDLLASVFPDQVACAENLPGEIDVPDHPLVAQTLFDCLHEAMDVEAFEQLLRRLEAGEIRIEARDLTEPSPLAAEVLSARPYAFLDDAPLEERRTQAVMSRRWLDPQTAADLGKLDAAAIERVREEAWPDATNADELHDALLWLGFMTRAELAAQPQWLTLIEALQRAQRVTCVQEVWIAAERAALFAVLFPDASFEPPVPLSLVTDKSREDALTEIVHGRLEGLGPTTRDAIASSMQMSPHAVQAALVALEASGAIMRGRFTTAATGEEWCERRLLARIHRYTVKRLRAEIEPLEARDFLRFLFEWQSAGTQASRKQGPDAVAALLTQLEGFEAPAGAWETELLPTRMLEYEPSWLDEHCLAGRFIWARLASRASPKQGAVAPVRATPIVLMARRNVRVWSGRLESSEALTFSSKAERVVESLRAYGASFFDEIVDSSGLLPTQVEEALAELVALGLVNSDSFTGLRALLVPASRRRSTGGHRRRRIAMFGMADAGRWTLVRRELNSPSVPNDRPAARDDDAVEHVARVLLRRWGVVFWRLLAREADWLPPWRDLLSCYRRLEARGEIRGGRFVRGFSGEQFALPEAVGLMRETRRQPAADIHVSVSAADPLNLFGILTPGPRIASLTGNRVLYRDGLPLAALVAGEVKFLQSLDPAQQWQAQGLLLRRHVPGALADLE